MSWDWVEVKIYNLLWRRLNGFNLIILSDIMLEPDEHYSFSTFMLGWWSALIPKKGENDVEESDYVEAEAEEEKEEVELRLSFAIW